MRTAVVCAVVGLATIWMFETVLGRTAPTKEVQVEVPGIQTDARVDDLAAKFLAPVLSAQPAAVEAPRSEAPNAEINALRLQLSYANSQIDRWERWFKATNEARRQRGVVEYPRAGQITRAYHNDGFSDDVQERRVSVKR